MKLIGTTTHVGLGMHVSLGDTSAKTSVMIVIKRTANFVEL